MASVFPYYGNMTKQVPDKPQFRAELMPHRSLSPRGFAFFMSMVAGLSFVGGIVFFVIGAWPVIGFIGLDVLLIYWAFKLSFRDSERREVIEVRDHDVIVMRLAPGKPDQMLQFQRSWLRVELEEDKKRELIGPLKLCERGRAYEIGSFLSPQDRKEFYAALKGAIVGVRI